MSMQQRGLGRGLDALLGGAGPHTAATPDDVVMVPLDAIQPNRHQPRKSFREDTLKDLADSIRAQGVLQPILLRPLSNGNTGYELIAGERRWRAAQLAKLRTIPALIKNVSDEISLTLAIIENLQREDLNPLEEALGFSQLQQLLDLSHESLAERVGKSRSTVTNALRLLQLPDSAQQALRDGHITAGHARALLSLKDSDRIDELQALILAQGLSVREAENCVAHFHEHGAFPSKSTGSSDAPASRTGRHRPAERSDEVLAIETELSELLGSQVRLNGSVRRGKLLIPYTSPEQLLRIRELLSGSR